MTELELIEVPVCEVLAEVTMPMVHRCPFRDEVDCGEITLSWDVDGETLELHALRAWLNQYADMKVSHEWLTRDVADVLRGLGLSGVSVVTAWATAGGKQTFRA